MIFDCADVQPWDIDIQKMTDLMQIGIEYFATTGKKSFVINLPWIMKQAYNVIYYFMPEFTRNSIVVYSSKEVKKGALL